MRKTIAILMALCLLCASCAALADTEAPTFDSLPLVVSEDENTTIEEADFEGEWVLSAAFLNREYLDPQTLAESIGFNFEPIVIGNGKIQQDVQQENGEFVTTETECTLDGSQLVGQDGTGLEFVFELLEDGNLAMSIFLPREGETVDCLSLYLVHPEK